MKEFDIDKAYTTYSNLDKLQRKMVIDRLNAEGINVSAIRCYVYKEAPGIKHIFFRFKENKEDVPYFSLNKEQLSKIQEIIKQIAG
ncbi:MAG: hypothetical protein LUC91_00210 [Prevotella sp.]|nr:hypothetical protein [Prevotella sp.]